MVHFLRDGMVNNRELVSICLGKVPLFGWVKKFYGDMVKVATFLNFSCFHLGGDVEYDEMGGGFLYP